MHALITENPKPMCDHVALMTSGSASQNDSSVRSGSAKDYSVRSGRGTDWVGSGTERDSSVVLKSLL